MLYATEQTMGKDLFSPSACGSEAKSKLLVSD
jgi:hypothetical protein